MKRLLCLFLLIVVLMCFGCGQKEKEKAWRDDFEVTYEHIEKSKFDNPNDELNAILDGTFVYEADNYTIKNTTNYVFTNINLVFDIIPTGGNSFVYKEYIGTLQQGETKTKSLLHVFIENEMKKNGYDGLSYDFVLKEIEYVVK